MIHSTIEYEESRRVDYYTKKSMFNEENTTQEQLSTKLKQRRVEVRGELSIVTPPREEIKDPSGTYNISTNIKRSKIKSRKNYVETLLRRLKRLRNQR